MRIVSPHSSEPKSCGACESGETFQRIFIREFRDDFFARAKAEFVIGDVNSLIDLTDEMHFNSACAGIVDRTAPPEQVCVAGLEVADGRSRKVNNIALRRPER